MSQMVSGGPTAYLQQMKGGFKYEPCKVIAEIGCNHMGSFETAKELMLLAKATGAGYAKFQKRCPRELLTKEQYDAPHPVPHNAYGQTYGAHREFLEFSKEQHEQLHAYGKEIGIEWATSVWDVTSAREMAGIPCDYLKVPSACNNHFDMLKVLRDEYAGDVHVSTGMTTLAEIEDVVAFFEATGQAKRLVVYNCTSGYPVPFPSVCMLELARTWKGTDHAASLEAGGFGKLVRDLEATHQALTLKASEILPIEDEQRDKLKFRKAEPKSADSPKKKAKN
ncbi:acid synthase [Aureococcus anophagefferens]|nr:acid synthase [Aureococcus anophagefferens]